MMYNKLFKEESTVLKKRVHLFLVIFGTLCGAISFFMSVIEIIKAFSDTAPVDVPLKSKDPPQK